jgi:hypothetical protein
VTIDSSKVVTEIRYRDTTIYIKIPGKHTIDSIMVTLPASRVSPTRLFSELEYCKAISFIKENKMFLSLSQKDTVIEAKLKNAIKEVLSTSEHWRIETVRLTAEVKQAQKEGYKEGKKDGRRQGITCTLLGIVISLLIYWYVKMKL